ncbi:MAG: 50S ribosome-binding GTPase, partial [Gammaproteobacteria bacterium]|nr:50S ribosome-binding GTPase [Gammaproteobacteria bacterium]
MPVRFLISIAIFLLALLMLFLVLVASETALTVWHYLKQAPLWVQVGYGVVLAGLPLLTLVFFWNWLRPKRKPKKTAERAELSVEALQEDLVSSARTGIDVSEALEELHEQRRRRGSGEIYIAVFGEVSSGKSSLVRALLPEAGAASDPRAGTTVTISHYAWTAPSGDRVVIADLPGFNLADDREAMEETRRAHLVIFLCDGDLTATQAEQVMFLKKLEKPLLLALNKTDRYSDGELETVLDALRAKTGLSDQNVVAIQSGGREEIIRLLGEGIERRETRERSAEIGALRNAVQRHLDHNPELMESLRETAVLM